MPCMVPPCGWRQHMAAFRSAASSDITAAVLSHLTIMYPGSFLRPLHD